MSVPFAVEVDRCARCPGWFEGRNQCKVTGLNLWETEKYHGYDEKGLPKSCPLRCGRVELYTNSVAQDECDDL
jgi:hypothetical protein